MSILLYKVQSYEKVLMQLLHTQIIPIDLELLQHAFFGQIAAEITLNAAG